MPRCRSSIPIRSNADGAQPGDSGEKGAAAVKRYRTDQVKKVEIRHHNRRAAAVVQNKDDGG